MECLFRGQRHYPFSYIKVIGNIFDNQELLEAEE